ncbi:MAG: hypothetical protein QOF29_2386 [bacterium]|jgi:hypothetical protein
MSDLTEITTLEARLLADLETLGERARDETFAAELYRALANNVWRCERVPGEHLSVSWQRAERLVNEWRRRHGEAPLELAQSGGEGEFDRTVAEELGRLGWTAAPLDTGRHDPEHVGQPESPPPPDQGKRMAPVPPPDPELEEAHDAASAEARRKAGA